MGGDNCYTNNFLLLLHCCMKAFSIHWSLLQMKQSKSLGSSQRPESIKPLHVWNSVQHFRLHKSTYLKLKFSLRALLLNSWPTWQSVLFPTSAISAYKWTRNSCSQGLDSCFHCRAWTTFDKELLHWTEHQGNVCSHLYHKQNLGTTLC